MSASERHREILVALSDQASVRVSELARQLGVSDVTIRSDLSTLERQGRLTRVHGGAIRRQEGDRRTPFLDRQGRNGRLKRWIAQRASALVDDGDRIFVDSGTTAFAMLAGLHERRRLTIVTNGIDAARAASANPSTRVVLLGGILRAGRSSVVGPLTEAALRSWQFDKAFLSGSGFSFEEGLLDDSQEEADVKRAAVSSAAEVIAMVDSTKLPSSSGVSSFATPGQIDQMLVDDLASTEHVERLLGSGTPVSICGDGRAALLRGSSGSSGSSGNERRRRLGFANLTEDHPFSFAVRLGLERAAVRAGDVDLFVADNAMSGPVALENVDFFVRHEVDLVIEYQFHATYGAVIMTRFREAGIPVIAVDVPMPGATYFGVDNYVAGQMGGRAAADAAMQRWGGAVDHVISLELTAAGRTIGARMQGQLDALRSRISLTDSAITHIDIGIDRADAHVAVADVLHAFPERARVVVLAGTDEVGLGAIDAIEQAGRSDLSIVVSQGADADARAEIMSADSPLVGAISYVPEHYGAQLVSLATAILANEPVAPAVYIEHELVTRESMLSGAHEWLGPIGRLEDEGHAAVTPQPPQRGSASATEDLERRAATVTTHSTK